MRASFRAFAVVLVVGALLALHGAAPRENAVLINAQLTVAKTFVVNSTSDAPDAALNGICATSTGVCSLRAAMNEANFNVDEHDTINFDIPGTGVHTINIASTLPLVTDNAGMTVDGYTQPGSAVNTDPFADNAQITIEIAGDGSLSQDAFFIQSPHNLVKGVAMDKLRRSFWLFGLNAYDNTIVGSFIGTNPAGTYGASVAVAGASGAVMQQGASDNFIGKPGLENRNVISGNSHQGVALYDNGTERNTIQNNIIGLNPAGTARLGNRSHGVDVNTWSSDTLVGGMGPGERNVVSGNYQTGVEISHNVGTLRNKVIGNWIGTAPDGETAPAYATNLQLNVRLEGMAACDAVCPPDQGFSEVRNNVLANSQGGVLADKGTHDAIIANNLIGVLPNGTPAGATVFGVRIEKGALNNTVGPGNVIAYNDSGISAQEVGINPESATPVPTYGAKFTQNSIHDNMGLGIDLAPLGAVNANDPGDADEGVNHLINFPEFATPTSSAIVSGTACAGCTVEVFLADGPANAFGEGQTYLTSAVANGAGAWTALLPPSAAGKVITATATDPGNDTSEFSVNRTVPLPKPSNQPPTAAVNVSCAHVTCNFNASASSDSDGSVVWYSFDFGDGTTAGGTSPTVSHDYTSTGTPTVSVTVTDNDGATAVATTTANPVNLVPVAAFTPSCTFQVCSFNGNASTDPDGSVASYAWDFGDGQTGTGANASHTYSTTQSYNVTLTVTDNDGATGFIVHPVTVNALPPLVNVLDDFGRTVASGWGSAPVGGPYTNPIGEAPSFSVGGGVGRITLATAGVARTAWLNSISERDIDVSATVATDKAPSGTGYGQTFSVIGRRVALNTQYNGRVRFATNGSVVAAITLLNGTTTETVLGGLEVVVPGLTYSPGTRFRTHLSISGANPTTLKLRVWLDGQPEPSTWNVTRTDSTPALQGAGSVGVSPYMSGTSTNAPVVFSVDDLQASVPDLPAVPVFTSSCVNETCSLDASASIDPDGTITTYAWDFGDGNTFSSPSPTTAHTFAAFQSYDVKLTVTDNRGVTANLTQPVTPFNAVPLAAFTVNCDALSCTFDSAGSSDSDGTIASYAWDFGDGGTSTDANPAHAFLAPDTYSVSLLVTDNDGGIDVATLTFTVLGPNQLPTSLFSGSCSMLACTFDGTSSYDTDGSVVNYAWTFSDGTSDSGVIVNHTFPFTGTWTATLVVTDDRGGSGSSLQSFPLVGPNINPTPSFTISCAVMTCNVNATASSDIDGTIASYDWDFGDGTTFSSASPTTSHPYLNAGTYPVKLTVTDNSSGTATLTKTGTVAPAPYVYNIASDDFSRTVSNAWGTADLGGNYSVVSAPPFSVNGSRGRIALNAGTGQGAVLNGVSAPDTNSVVTFTTDKTPTGSGQMIYEKGRVISTTNAYMARVRLASDGLIRIALAKLSNSSSETLIGSEIVVPGTYTAGTDLKVRVDVFGTSPTTLRARVWPAASAEPSNWQVSATDSTAQLQTSGGVGLHMYLSGSVTNGPVAVTFDTYRVNRSNAPPTPVVSSGCTDLTCNFDSSLSSDPDGTIASRLWVFGDGTTSTAVAPQHVFAVAGTYPVTLNLVDDRGLSSYTVANVPVIAPNVLPVADFTVSCTFLNCSFNGAPSQDTDGTIVSYAWKFGDGATDTGITPPPHLYAGPGSESVELTVTDDRGGQNVKTIVIGPVENTGPTAAFTFACTDLVCTFDGTTSTDSDGTIPSYAWDFGDGTFDTGATPTPHAFPGTGTYTVILDIADDQGAPAQIQHDVSVLAANVLPTAAFTYSCTELVCDFDGSTSSDTDGTIQSYAWDFGDGTSDTGVIPPPHTFPGTGTRTVTLTVSDDRSGVGVVQHDVFVLAANVPPTAAFTVNCPNLTCNFNGTSSSDSDGTIQSYAWDFGDGTTGTGPTPSHPYAIAGVYPVQLTVTDDRSGTNSTTGTASPVAPQFLPVWASDSFTRTVASGWGTATQGGAWTSNTSGSVDGSAGHVVLGAGGAATYYLSSVSTTDASVYATVSTDKAATGFGQMFSLVGRRVNATEQYRGRIRFAPDGGVWVVATKIDGSSSEILLGTEVRATGLVHAPGTQFRVRTEVFGTAPTRIRVKVWPVGQSEPVAWNVNITDSSALIQAAGSVGLTPFLSGSVTNGPINFTIDDFLAQTANTAPVAAFTSNCTGLDCTFDGTASTDAEDAISYAWSFGDGGTATGSSTPPHTYTAAGSYTVTLTVTDARGAVGAVQHVVVVS